MYVRKLYKDLRKFITVQGEELNTTWVKVGVGMREC